MRSFLAGEPQAVGRVITGRRRRNEATGEGTGATWLSLRTGDILRPGCVVRVGEEGDPGLGGGRVVLSEAEDETPFGDGRMYFDNGFCAGKDPGATQPQSLFDQSLTAMGSLAATSASKSRYRVEVSPGQTQVSVLVGAAEVKSAATHARALLQAGQYMTVTAQGLGPVTSKSFTDVASNPYRTAIVGMALKGIVNGYKVGDLWEFRPTDTVKRAQFAKMIVGTMTIPPKSTTATRFTDLGSPDAAGYPHVFVQAAYGNGITTGTNTAQTLFAPWEPIKRAQVVGTRGGREAGQPAPGGSNPSLSAPRRSSPTAWGEPQALGADACQR